MEKKGKGLQNQSLWQPQPEQFGHEGQTDCQKEAGSEEDLFTPRLCSVRCQDTGRASHSLHLPRSRAAWSQAGQRGEDQ